MFIGKFITNSVADISYKSHPYKQNEKEYVSCLMFCACSQETIYKLQKLLPILLDETTSERINGMLEQINQHVVFVEQQRQLTYLHVNVTESFY